MARNLASILLQQGLVSQETLEKALAAQFQYGGTLGRHLVAMGALDERTLAGCISEQFRLPWVTRDRLVGVPPPVIQLVPGDLALSFQLLPLTLDGQILTLAMADPSNAYAIDQITYITGYVANPMVALESDMDYALSHHYGLSPRPQAPAPDLRPAGADLAPLFAPLKQQGEQVYLLNNPKPYIPGLQLSTPQLAQSIHRALEKAASAKRPAKRPTASGSDPFRSRLTKATDLASWSETLLAIACEVAARGALFQREGNRLDLIRLHGEGAHPGSLSLDLANAPAIKRVLDRGAPNFGPPPQSPAMGKLLAHMGQTIPSWVFLVPIGPSAYLLYGDSGTRGQSVDVPLEALSALGQAAWESFQGLRG